MKTLHEIIKQIGPIAWPGNTMGSDIHGDTEIRACSNGELWFFAYEWEDFEAIREAILEEVALALAHNLLWAEQNRVKDEDATAIGRSVLRAIEKDPGVLNRGGNG